MPRPVRVVFVSLVLVGLAAGAALALPLLTGPDGPLPDVAGAFSLYLTETKKLHRLEADTDAVARRNGLKADVIDRVLAGRATFSEAVREFDLIEDQIPIESDDGDAAPPGGTAGKVLSWLNCTLAEHPEKHRLLRKFQREFGKSYPGEPGA